MTNSKNIYFILYQNCIPVKGYKRSIICDLQLSRYRSIPNLLYEIIKLHKNKTVKQIKLHFKNQYNDGIDAFFNLLVEENFGFYTDRIDNFPLLNLAWESPFKITNCILDINQDTNYNFSDVVKQLDYLGCQAIQIRGFGKLPFTWIQKISDATINTSISHLEYILEYDERNKEKYLLKILKVNPRIRQIFIYRSKKKKIISNLESLFGSIVYITDDISSNDHCGIINKSYFQINMELFTESQKFNSCLNKKISIDTNGDIKNCPSMQNNYGNIKDVTLEMALLDKKFKKYWNISKDKISICKDCEFRYICTDCRAYIENPNDIYSKPLKCSYNPYEALWN